MDKPMLNWHFKIMAFGYKFRDLFLPPRSRLEEVGIRPGFHVLDYGCGSGSYVATAAELVGESGEIYALDIHPLAVKQVQDIASRRKLNNVKTIRSDCKTGLPDSSVDAVLLYDIFHMLSDPGAVLGELHRVLKPNGILSFSDHHMKESDILPGVANGGLFRLSRKDKRTYTFIKER